MIILCGGACQAVVSLARRLAIRAFGCQRADEANLFVPRCCAKTALLAGDETLQKV